MSRPKRDQEGASRQRILKGANALLRRYGFGGVALSAIAKESDAPMGSVYFHFPGGKEQIAVEALQYGANIVSKRMSLDMVGESDSSAAFIRCAKSWADALEASNWAGGCPVAPTALQMSDASEPIRKTSELIFSEWTEIFAERLRQDGYADAEAKVLAEQILAILEGAELLARVKRNRSPLDNLATVLPRLLAPRSKN